VLTPQDHERIEAAVAAAEAGTSGDIFCVLAGEVSSYREVPIAWGAAIALFVPPLVLALAFREVIALVTGGGWTVAQASAVEPQLALTLTAYTVAQVLLFGVTTLVVSIPAVRRRLTPRFLKRHRVKKAAYHHFAAAKAHTRDSDTGIVLFIALVERQVEILADQAIHEKVGEGLWKDAAAAIGAGMKTPDPTSGIVGAIGLCGEALKAHFPSSAPRAAPDRPEDD
jgi:putative membrane protein